MPLRRSLAIVATLAIAGVALSVALLTPADTTIL
jgi:hypothetical protein